MGALVAADRSQSEVLGYTLLIGLTLIGVGGVVALGGTALDDARHTSETQFAEQSLSQFDSEASLVALGRSNSRRVDLGRPSRGSYRIREDAGWLRIRHVNYTGGDASHTIHNATLGTLSYREGDTSIAYQGGGVWRSDGRGSTMVSPPEIHYRGTTLVLPVVTVTGEGQSASRPAVLVRKNGSGTTVYPNASAAAGYPDGSAYANPVENGTVELSVNSDYYRAWADYFRARTTGEVSVDDANETVTVELVAPGVIGDFDFPSDGDAISLRGMTDEHAISNFTTTLSPDDVDSADFANLDWSLVADTPARRLEVAVESGGAKPCNGGPIDVELTYESGGETDTWQNDSAFVENGSGAFTYTCGDEPRLHVNFTGDTNLTYESGPEPLSFDQHDADDDRTYVHDSPDPGEVTESETGYLVNHYLALFDSSVDLEVRDGNGGDQGKASGSVDEEESFGHLDYDASGEVITFLHVTENEIRLEFT